MIQHRIDHPSAWTGAGLNGKEDLIFELTPRHHDAFHHAIKDVRSRGLPLDKVAKEDFSLEQIGTDIATIKSTLDEGRGIVVVRGFPVANWSRDDVELMYWGLGLHLGVAANQSVMGDRLGHVLNVSDVDPNARAYRSQQELSLHNDLGEYHGMFCLNTAKEGGESRFASSIAVHNAMLAEAPHHLPRLYRGYSLYRVGEEGPDELPYTPHRVPVFSERDGYLSSRYMRGFIVAAATLREEILEEEDIAALDYFDQVAHRDEVMVEFMLEPGEATFYNNYFVMHARTAFTDDKPNGRARHLLRLWLYTENGRPVNPDIELFDYPGFMYQPDKSPSGEGKLLRGLGAEQFSKDALSE